MSAEGKEYIATRAIIVDKKNKVLLGKRGRGIGAGQFALIGGKPEKGETLEECVVREVKEETGLQLVNPVFWIETADNKTIPEQTWHVSFYIGSAKGEIKLKEDEVVEVAFVDEDNLNNFDIAFNHKEVLQRFFQEKIKKV